MRRKIPLPAIKLALENKAEAIWITVQLSQDGVPVLYRPSDLSALTDHTGKISSFSAAELTRWTRDGHGAVKLTLAR